MHGESDRHSDIRMSVMRRVRTAVSAALVGIFLSACTRIGVAALLIRWQLISMMKNGATRTRFNRIDTACR